MIYYFVSFKIFVKGLNGGTFTVMPDKPLNSLRAAEMKLSRMTCNDNGVFDGATIMSRSIDVVDSNSPEYMEHYSYILNNTTNELVIENTLPVSPIVPILPEFLKKMEEC